MVYIPGQHDSNVASYRTMASSLKTAREPYDAYFDELGRYFWPSRGRFFTRKSRGQRPEPHKQKDILNARPSLARRTSQSGMQTGMTSPARPWFRLIASDPDLRDNRALREHLSQAERAMRQLLQTSGLYGILHILWGDLLTFGTDCMILEDDPEFGLKGIALVPGEYWIGTNSRGFVDTLYREVDMPVQRVVGKFVYQNDPNREPDWDRVSTAVKNMWDRGDVQSLVPVSHIIAPRHNRDSRSFLAKDKPFASVYWEEGNDVDNSTTKRTRGFLMESGYDYNPIIASRWDLSGFDVYGASPAMDALSDAKMLQVLERDKSEAIRHMIRPPMNVPTSLRDKPYSFMPESVIFTDDPANGAQPVFMSRPPLGDLQVNQTEIEQRIDEGMYANLFLMISRLDRREITAREIDERHEEKMLGLGPVLERQHAEKLGPLVRALYRTVVERGMVDPLPEEFEGTDVEVDYISILGQAQKAVATAGIERFYGFLGNVAAADETVLDLPDNDKAVMQYADMLGVFGDMFRPEQEIAQIRENRQAQLQQQMEVEQAAQVAPAAKATAETAKVLADADATGRPVDILRNLGLR